MQDLINFGEKKSVYNSNKSDIYQNIFDHFIINNFFPWPVNLILIGHWLLRSLGTSVRYILEFRKHEPNTIWPYSKTNWYIANSIPSLFWLSGEILGDWYPLIRTRVVTNNSRKIRIVYFTCLIYNITKLIGILHQFILPDLRITDENGIKVRDYEKSKIRWWIIIVLSQMTSCAYDLSVIASLKNCLFNKLEELKNNSNLQKNSFLEKFKKISEFRIILSMIISLIFLPFITVFVVIQINNYHKNNPNPKIIVLDSSIEQFRQVILNSQLLSKPNNSNYLVSNIKPFDYTNNIKINNFSK
ncbi:hypothetical protein H8356DRAFT_1370758 [Neocallimastix lanati (nom. inval.)]|uniref:G-protein coupled receptors family 1 profile domain-containing protein n=1 Tax=Neocallimastix californiae TaxID=1754190 RepID=A0A1Y2D7I0_9FUNG|nr:hypothetical protein H8356DRAFT_1370758 [Neocallimastix sp. JGI-2020a]ORY55230.1 hypothetical protein LY90DRAFT_507241 [Neocallimastix californiae]|eukprot:ORY55230.1 hypothetical protein LY90DRAFT_507241 [Neocallimastix californiae]